MRILGNNFFGIYEKALPPGNIYEKISATNKAGFDFLELSIDESDQRLQRLDWSNEETNKILEDCKKNNIFIRSICFSGQRKYPMGSHDLKTRTKSLLLFEKCIKLAFRLNVKIIQLAGYDVYYEEKDEDTRKWFMVGLAHVLKLANKYAINISIEIMDDPFINSITKFLRIKKELSSPWLSVYPDLGNLSAWHNSQVLKELEIGWNEIVAFHIKDTLEVTETFQGKFKNVDFGKGCVDFAKIFTYLRKKDYSGAFLIEAWYEDFPNPISTLNINKKFILDIFRKCGWDLC